MSAPTQIKVIGKMGAILDLFREQGPELRLQEITQRTGLDSSTTTRIVTSMCQIGLLRFDELQRLYSPGLLMVELSRAVISRFGFYELVHRELLAISSEHGWPAYLGVLNDSGVDSVVYLDAVSASPGVTPRTAFGQRLPSHSSASGKLLLALGHVDPATLNLERRTATTVADSEALRAEFAQIRSTGYSVTRGEEVDGYCGVAAPIVGPEGIVAAIGIETDSPDFEDVLPRMTDIAVTKARGISAALSMRAAGGSAGQLLLRE